MKLIEDSAIVVGGRDLGESDLLVTLVTGEHGKERVVAKGARRSRKRFLNALEPCTLLRARIAPSRTSSGLSRLDSVEIIESYPSIRASAETFMLACLCCELSELWSKEGDSSPALFNLFKWYLDGISDKTSDVLMCTIAFKTRLLTISGYRQIWDRCAICGGKPRGAKVSFSIDQGGCICDDCSPETGTAHMLAAGTLRSVAYMDEARYHALGRLKMGSIAMKEAWKLLSALHRYYLQRTPMSYRVIEPIIKKRLK